MLNKKALVEAKIEKALTALSKSGEMLKGNINRVLLGEKKKGGGKRESYLLTFKGDSNKTKTLYISKDRLEKVEKMIKNYQKAKLRLEEIVELNVELFKMP